MENLFNIIPNIIFIISFSAASVAYFKKKKKLLYSRKEVGTVTSVFEEKSSKGVMIKYPLIQYRSENGSLLEYKSKLGSSSWKINKGDEINIFINRKNSNDIEMENFLAQWGISLIFSFAAFTSFIMILLVNLS